MYEQNIQNLLEFAGNVNNLTHKKNCQINFHICSNACRKITFKKLHWTLYKSNQHKTWM